MHTSEEKVAIFWYRKTMLNKSKTKTICKHLAYPTRKILNPGPYSPVVMSMPDSVVTSLRLELLFKLMVVQG